TFWGKGIRQGHTQAMKNIEGVTDAIQMTHPNNHKKKKIKHGKVVGGAMHKRVCFVVAPRKMQAKIRHEIITMPDYFLGYKTSVKFVTQNRLNTLKTSVHCGEVITKNDVINFKLKLPSNPNFTAKVMCTYARCVQTKMEHQNYGCFTIFDVPLCEILDNKFLWL
ncbi:MAG: diaminopimelate dehydrogenase, partial [Clostridia bacterium]|nr:diaminopimelate dehydrogenase [Clostridia bacterium]